MFLKISSFFVTTLLSIVFFSSPTANAQDIQLQTFPQPNVQNIIEEDHGMSPWLNKELSLMAESTELAAIMRVGSPFFCMTVDSIRRKAARGEELSDLEFLLLHIESMPGISGNSMLVAQGHGKYIQENPMLAKGSLNPHEYKGVSLYLYNEGTGLLEILWEDATLYGAGIPLRYALSDGFDEVYTAFRTTDIGDRFGDTGLAFWNSTKGLLYSFTGIFEELFNGFDLARAIKSGVRMPMNVLQLSGMLVTKTVRLPIDLIMSAILGIKMAASPTPPGTEIVYENNDYEFELRISEPRKEVWWNGFARFERNGVGRFLIKDQKGARIRRFKYSVLDPSNENPKRQFLGEIEIGSDQFSFLGVIDGRFDIAIRSQIYWNNRPGIAEPFESTEKNNWVSRTLKTKLVGTLGLDD